MVEYAGPKKGRAKRDHKHFVNLYSNSLDIHVQGYCMASECTHCLNAPEKQGTFHLRLTGSKARVLFMPAVVNTTSSNRGTLPPPSPVLPPCTKLVHFGKSRPCRFEVQHVIAQNKRTCGTIASCCLLQCRKICETWSVVCGLRATRLLPSYLFIQSLHKRFRFCVEFVRTCACYIRAVQLTC